MSDGYRPTERLRFVVRLVDVSTEYANIVQERKILQQLWDSIYVGEAPEWRDVETVDAE